MTSDELGTFSCALKKVLSAGAASHDLMADSKGVLHLATVVPAMSMRGGDSIRQEDAEDALTPPAEMPRSPSLLRAGMGRLGTASWQHEAPMCQGRPAVCRAFVHMVEEISKTGQAGGLPQNVCCNTPDLRMERSVMNE